MSNTNVMQESWERVPGFESLYAVSDMGRVKTLRTGKIKSQSKNRDGQNCVTFYDGSGKHRKGHVVKVRTLVLATFKGPRPEGLVACNLDGNRDDCSVGNLGYVTLSEARLLNDRTRSREPRMNRHIFGELQRESQESGETVIERGLARGISEESLRKYVRRVVLNRTKEAGKTESTGLGANYVGH